jgi:DNA-binding CsgD family transcriptional regulator
MTIGRIAGLEQHRARLIEHIYSGIMDPAAWPNFLQELVACTNSRSARLLVMNPEATRVISSLKLNIDDDCHRKYVDYYVNACPWRKELRRKQPGQLYSTYLHFSCRQPDFYRSEFFNDWAQPQDIHHGICGTVYQDSARSVQLLVQRTRGQGHYSEADTSFFNDFIPHLQQSFLLTRQLEATRTRAEAIAITAGGERLPFLLLDIFLRITYCSEGAEKLIAAEPVLTVREGQLRIIDEPGDRCLRKLLLKILAAADTRELRSAGGTLEVLRPGRASLQLLVKPIHPDIAVLADAPKGYVAVYLYDPEAGVDIDGERLRSFYSLSKAETRVAMALVAAVDPAAAARHCCISLHTLRSHLKVIFTKTATHSQAGLMKLLLADLFRRS